MVKIYTSLEYFKKKEIIYDNEGFFNLRMCGNKLSNRALDKMLKVDNAKLIDIGLSTIKTPFGVCDLKCLSTGCKTVINAIYVLEHKNEFEHIKAINATECGYNAISVIIDFLEKKQNMT